jgi:membrane-bound lytic murein transglycosylase B
MKELTLIPLILLSTGCVQKTPKQQTNVIYNPVPTTITHPTSNTTTYPTTNTGTVITYDPIPVTHTATNTVTQIVTQDYEQPRSRYLQGAYSNNYKLKNFINTMAQKHHYDKYKLYAIFSTVQRDPQALEKIGAFKTSKPSQSKATLPGSWDKYRGNFLTESRISKGVKFWRENVNYLNEASQRYGVAPEYIIGIIGVETNFGGYTGKHSILDALTSIAFEFPKREKFFQSELENYLLMIRDEKLPPQKIKGSYAGAFGLSQFMPSSFREYAVDLDQDGHINLFTAADAIGSIANYFKGRGKWNNRIPVAMKTYYNKARFYGLATGFRTRYTQSHLMSLGMRPSSNFYGYRGKVSLIKLSRYNRDELWWGTENFHAIARYNPQDYYAMAVHQLAQAIRKAYYKR